MKVEFSVGKSGSGIRPDFVIWRSKLKKVWVKSGNIIKKCEIKMEKKCIKVWDKNGNMIKKV